MWEIQRGVAREQPGTQIRQNTSYRSAEYKCFRRCLACGGSSPAKLEGIQMASERDAPGTAKRHRGLGFNYSKPLSGLESQGVRSRKTLSLMFIHGTSGKATTTAGCTLNWLEANGGRFWSRNEYEGAVLRTKAPKPHHQSRFI